MRKIIAIGTGINTKTQRRVHFRISDSLSEKGLETLRRNVTIRVLRINRTVSAETYKKLRAIKDELGLPQSIYEAEGKEHWKARSKRFPAPVNPEIVYEGWIRPGRVVVLPNGQIVKG